MVYSVVIASSLSFQRLPSYIHQFPSPLGDLQRRVPPVIPSPPKPSYTCKCWAQWLPRVLGGGESWKRLTFHVSKDFDFHMLKRRIQEILGRCLKCIPLMGLQNTHVIVSYVAIFCGGFCHQTCGVCVCVVFIYIAITTMRAINKQRKSKKDRFISIHTIQCALHTNQTLSILVST